MVYYRTDNGCPFYKLQGATPKEFMGSASDPENPTLADAFVSLLSAMKLYQGKGLGNGTTMRPTMEQMVAAAKLEREAAAAAEARLEEANQTVFEAAADDQDDADKGSPERDCHAPVTPVTRDTVTVTLLSRSESVTCPSNLNADKDLWSVTCHADVTPAPTSSSISSLSSNEDRKKTTATTSGVTPAVRDTFDILDSFVSPPASQASASPESAKRNRVFERFATSLGVSAESVAWQARHEPAVLATRLVHAGIDTKTGLPLNGEASGTPEEAREDIGMTTEPLEDDKPAAGIVEPCGEDEPDHDTLTDDERYRLWQEDLKALQRQGVPVPTLNSVSGTGDIDAFERDEASAVASLVAARCLP